MTAQSYRIDTVCANLIEHLEGARRTWPGRPDEAHAGFRRIAEETLDKVTGEHDELFGASGWGETLRREVLDTFLPRYERLAVDQTDLEVQGYNAWRGGDPVARVVVTAGALLGALALERWVHHPVALVAFAGVFLAPVVPEIRAFAYRRRYRRLLQEVVDDMSRIQDELERYANAAPAPVSESERAPRKPRQTERG